MGPPQALRIRPYAAADRDQVRYICYATGYLGQRVDWLYRDASSFADLFSGYYTDAEPSSAMVIERDGVVVGYMLGCLDTSKTWDPARTIGRHVVRRGLFFRPGTAGFMWRSVWDSIRGPIPAASHVDPRWPAHLHIDLLPAARGAGMGALLVRGWLDRLVSLGIPGCHIETFAENTGALAFFSAMGFVREGEPVLVPGFRSPSGGRHHVQLMVRSLDAHQQ
jgi:ribosomal protein S18 acetylase RimI-like enzyme